MQARTYGRQCSNHKRVLATTEAKVAALQAKTNSLKAIVDSTDSDASKIDYNQALEELSTAQVLEVSSRQGAKETCVYQSAALKAAETQGRALCFAKKKS